MRNETLLPIRSIAVGIFLCISQAFTVAGAVEERDLTLELERLVARNRGFGAGVVRVGYADGRTLQAASGRIAGPDSVEVTPGIPFEIASVTKAVTAATVLRLAEQGRVGLDWPLSRILPERAIRGWRADLTIRELLSHTGGLANYWEDGPLDREGNNAFLRAFLADPGRTWAPLEILDYAREIPGRKRGRFWYSDTNYVLLGLVIERVCGKPLHEVFRREIFVPLGMKSTWMSHSGPRGKGPVAHRYEGDEDLTDVPRQSADWAGGGLISTAEDLEKFLRGVFCGGLFRSPESLSAMRETVPVGESGISYGLGLYRVDLGGGRGELIGHDGHGNSFAYYWPQRGITLTGTLNQTENDWWPLAEIVTGERETPAIETPAGRLEGQISVAWDSLYMYRGVNVLGSGGYGSGIQSTTLTLALAELSPVVPSVEVSQIFSTGSEDYRETSVTVGADTEIEGFDLGIAYNGSFGSYSGFFQSHEMRGRLGRGFDFGDFGIEPSVSGVLGLGPETVDGGGGGAPGCGFLSLRLDGTWSPSRLPLEFGVWAEGNFNFGYNSKELPDGEWASFSGANNFESGVSATWKIRGGFSLSAYGAWSRALADLPETSENTFFGGLSANYDF